MLSGAEPFKDVFEHNTAAVSSGFNRYSAPLEMHRWGPFISQFQCRLPGIRDIDWRERIMKDLKFMRSGRRWVMWTFCRLLKSLFAVRTSEGLCSSLKRYSASSIPSAVRSLNIDSRDSHRLITKSGLFWEMKTDCSLCWCLFSLFS